MIAKDGKSIEDTIMYDLEMIEECEYMDAGAYQYTRIFGDTPPMFVPVVELLESYQDWD